ncbi:uncharacterized protein LOC103521471, partial [Diaphorina citri]|uniref:Uncharacterized protein LOC103521471 n=1 Tax=Diaphorina citri TaxID=121845 RepID=A0A3Q0JHR2_DIACI
KALQIGSGHLLTTTCLINFQKELPLDLPPEEQVRTRFTDHFKFIQSNHMKALVWKNFLWMWRNVGVMCFIIGLPVAQIILFCLSIGHDPVGLHLAVVNYESNINDCAIYEKETKCELAFLSCKYLKYVKAKNQKIVSIHIFERTKPPLAVIEPTEDRLTSGAMLIERNEGILERGLVSGVTGIEILLAHVICQFLIMVFQSVMVIVMALLVFHITNHGDVLLVILLTCLTGLCGMCFGFVVSCVTDSERNATYLAMGSFLPIVMLCGK